MKKKLFLLSMTILLSGFSFPEETKTHFPAEYPDTITYNLSEIFGDNIDTWEYDKENKSYTNKGFKVKLNDDLIGTKSVVLSGLTKEAAYAILELEGIAITPTIKYVLEDGNALMSETVVTDEYVLLVNNLQITYAVGFYYDEDNIEDIFNSSYKHLVEVLK